MPSTNAALPGAIPLLTTPAHLAAGAAAIITGVLLLLHVYRRRPYILRWTVGWACLTASLAIDTGATGGEPMDALAAGASQFLVVATALCFIAAASAYRGSYHDLRVGSAAAVAAGVWFVLMAVGFGLRAVYTSGYALAAITLATAGVLHLRMIRNARLLGAVVIGAALLVAAGTNVWMLMSSAARGGPRLSEAFFVELALYLVTALGMQLMTFEDMTHELRTANALLEAAQIELRQLVVTDPLTGLRNRRFFDEIIVRELNLHRRYGSPMSVMFLDIDQFKSINDTRGHAAGDRTLCEVAAFLTRNIRDADYLFRWGGDEFLLLLSCREEEAIRKGRELQSDFRRFAVSAGLPKSVGLSVGCAEVSPVADSPTGALTLADQRMYEDKRRRLA